ncbi:MAG: hypothetical protein QXR31_01785 [Zestosphaera sp.]
MPKNIIEKLYTPLYKYPDLFLVRVNNINPFSNSQIKQKLKEFTYLSFFLSLEDQKINYYIPEYLQCKQHIVKKRYATQVIQPFHYLASLIKYLSFGYLNFTIDTKSFSLSLIDDFDKYLIELYYFLQEKSDIAGTKYFVYTLSYHIFVLDHLVLPAKIKLHSPGYQIGLNGKSLIIVENRKLRKMVGGIFYADPTSLIQHIQF